MSKEDDLAIALAGSVVVQTFKYGVSIWKYRISKSKYGYYVATRKMELDEWEASGCVYPKVDSKGRITSFAGALAFTADRLAHIERCIEMCTNPNPTILVLNGAIAVF